jgi:alkylhydroperoxidase family enzyme
LVAAVLDDLETSPLDGRHKALFRFVAKVNHDSPAITPSDIETLHEAGWEDEAIFYAITVCALFNFYNRWIDATGVHAMSDAAHQAGGKRMAAGSYVR